MLIVGGGIYFYSQRKSQPTTIPVQNTQSLPSPIISASPSPTPMVGISNWLTYTNKDYSFSFKYPQQFQLTEKKTTLFTDFRNNVATKYPLSFSTGAIVNGNPDFAGFSVNVTSANNMTIEQYYKADILQGNTPDIVKLVAIDGNAQEAAIITNHLGVIKIYRFNNFIYEISGFQNFNSADNQDFIRPILPNILSTINFTGSKN